MKKLVSLIVVTCGFFLAGCCAGHHVTRWEYRMAHGLKEANELADQGWEVVNFATEDGPYPFLLKRPKP